MDHIANLIIEKFEDVEKINKYVTNLSIEEKQKLIKRLFLECNPDKKICKDGECVQKVAYHRCGLCKQELFNYCQQHKYNIKCYCSAYRCDECLNPLEESTLEYLGINKNERFCDYCRHGLILDFIHGTLDDNLYIDIDDIDLADYMIDVDNFCMCHKEVRAKHHCTKCLGETLNKNYIDIETRWVAYKLSKESLNNAEKEFEKKLLKIHGLIISEMLNKQ